MVERILNYTPPLIPQVQQALRYRLHFCSPEIVSFEVFPDFIRIQLTTDREDIWAEVRRKVERVVSGVRDGFIPPAERTIAERRQPVPTWAGAEVDIEDAGLIRSSGQGRAVLGPVLAGLIERIDRLLLEMADEFGAKPISAPALIGADQLAKVDYFRAFPHSLTFASHLPADVESIEQFSKDPLDANGEVRLPARPTGAVLSPAVCFHLYHFLENKTVHEEIDSYTLRGRSFRYESGAMEGLERLWDFTMREIVFVGEPDAVIQARKRSMDWILDLADRLGLVHRLKSASDPFFVGEFRQRTIFQAAFDLKYEWQVDLDPDDTRSVAAGSFNIHQAHFGKSFGIRSRSGDIAWTGCMAFGLERLALAILRQHGIQPESWPDVLKTSFKIAI